jgi:hypothetical protein
MPLTYHTGLKFILYIYYEQLVAHTPSLKNCFLVVRRCKVFNCLSQAIMCVLISTSQLPTPHECILCCFSDKIKKDGSNLYGISTYSLKILFISFFLYFLNVRKSIRTCYRTSRFRIHNIRFFSSC